MMKSKDITLVGLFASLTAIGTFISIPLRPVPITLQSFFVILSGILLGPKLGALSQIIYIFLGLIGIPIFSDFNGGLQSILKPSFGFIIGFVFAAYIAGRISHASDIISSYKIWTASVVATVIIYLFGLPYMYYILNIIMGKALSIKEILYIGCLLFLPGDILKIIISSMIGIKILPIIRKFSLINI